MLPDCEQSELLLRLCPSLPGGGCEFFVMLIKQAKRPFIEAHRQEQILSVPTYAVRHRIQSVLTAFSSSQVAALGINVAQRYSVVVIANQAFGDYTMFADYLCAHKYLVLVRPQPMVEDLWGPCFLKLELFVIRCFVLIVTTRPPLRVINLYSFDKTKARASKMARDSPTRAAAGLRCLESSLCCH
jgi:hypothetical protein